MSVTAKCPWCDQPGEAIHQDDACIEYRCTNENCQICRDEDGWEVVGVDVSHEKTQRGFDVFHFTDRYGEPCTLQDSSLATESAIWFGTSGRVQVGPPWKEFELPDNALVHSRMHLTRRQVEQLLPYLQHFVDTGALPSGVLNE